jgi:hypothetical protein
MYLFASNSLSFVGMLGPCLFPYENVKYSKNLLSTSALPLWVKLFCVRQSKLIL